MAKKVNCLKIIGVLNFLEIFLHTFNEVLYN